MPSAESPKNVLVARGQEIEIPKGTTVMYLIAASTLKDVDTVFMADNKEKPLTIHAMSEPVGQWDMAGLNQTAKTKM